jgi:hypothetical protein
MTVRYRIMRYEGSDTWLDSTKAHSFVQLDKELGEGRLIQSVWLESVPPSLETTFEVLKARVKE